LAREGKERNKESMPFKQMSSSSPLTNTSSTSGEARYFRQTGLTLIQVMVIFLIVGALGSGLINYFLDKRCESDPGSTVCTDRRS
jgi:hypothetical protein